ncbi:MAG: hypothetical protein Q9226_006712 [Calogaya cf. arnoldii]
MPRGIRWSQGCQTCRQRKIKCDEKQPTCSACERSGLTCPGPRTRTTFIQEHPNQSRRAPSKPVIVGTTTGEPSTVSQDASPSSSLCLADKAQAWLSSQSLNAAQGWNLTSPKQDYYTTLFVGKFDNMPKGAWTPFSWLNYGLMPENGNASISHRFTQNLTQAFFGHYFALPQVMKAAQMEYGRNLLILKKALGLPGVMTSEDLFRGILTAGIFELIMQTSSTAWITHINALAKIIQSRGPSAYQSLSGKPAIALCHYVITGYAIMLRKRTFFDSPTWRLTVSQHLPDDLLKQLADLNIQIPGLLEDYDNLCSSEDPPSVTFATHYDLRNRTISLLNSLLAWRWQWERQYADQVWEIPSPPSSQVPFDETSGKPIYSTHFEYPNNLRRGEIGRYNGMLCILLGLLRDICDDDNDSNASIHLLDRTIPVDLIYRSHRSPLCLPSDPKLSSRNAAAEHIRSVEAALAQESHVSSTGLIFVSMLNLSYKALPAGDVLREWIKRIYWQNGSAGGTQDMIKDVEPHGKVFRRFKAEHLSLVLTTAHPSSSLPHIRALSVTLSSLGTRIAVMEGLRPETGLAADLGGDIWHIINNLLLQQSRNSLFALRLTSQWTKGCVDPVLYRCLELSDEDDKIDTTRHNIQRLLDPSDDLSLHVRDLVVSNTKRAYTNLSRLMREFRAGDLETAIEKLHRLRSFTWNIRRPIPEAILAKLEQRWPDVVLSVAAHNHPITDTRSLHSPLLHSLSFCILNHTATVGATDQLEQYSKLPELREIMLRSGNLRKLDIKFEYNWMSRHAEWSGITANPHVLNLPLQPSDRLPPLQELTFSGPPETYEFTLAHCQLWKQCMDWSQIRRLDLGISCPQHFFEQLGNSLTSLKSLTMGVRTRDRCYTHWLQGPMTCDNLNTVQIFLTSVPALYEFDVTYFDRGFIEVLSGVLTRHKSLRKLYCHQSIEREGWATDRGYVYQWTQTLLERLCNSVHGLQDLTIDFPLQNGRWPLVLAELVSHLSRLDSLKVFVKLDTNATDFAEEYYLYPDGGGNYVLPPLNMLAREVTTNLFTDFFRRNAYASLTSLEVCFLRHRYEDRRQWFEMTNSVKIKRLERDDAPSPLEQGYMVETDGKWVEHDVRIQRPV